MRFTCGLVALSFVALACSPEGGGRSRRDGGGGTDTGGGFDVGPRPDVQVPDTGGMDCVADSYSAEETIAPVDIVWVIDNSGSMSEEASLVQEQMNSFASTISAAGLDVHVVLITSPGFVTVPPPLGTDATSFLKIDVDVNSSDSLLKLLSTFDPPRPSGYSSFLRRTAALHFIAVTDDESSLNASDFMSMMNAKLPRTFRFHSIASPPGSTHTPFGIGFAMDGCEGPNGEAADNGDEYWAISSMTGGRQLSICSSDWSSLFRELTTAIAIPMSLPCVYNMPPPPEGETLDPLKVNVNYTPGGTGTEETIPNVGDFSRCTGEGWYYEGDPAAPDRIILCPNTCRRLEADTTGRVDIAVGCATLLI